MFKCWKGKIGKAKQGCHPHVDSKIISISCQVCIKTHAVIIIKLAITMADEDE